MLQKPRPAASSSLGRQGSGGCKHLEKVAGWVSTGLYTAFFTSLDRCACVKLDTIEMQEPMMRSMASSSSSPSSSSSKTRAHSHKPPSSASPSPSPSPSSSSSSSRPSHKRPCPHALQAYTPSS